MFILEDLIHVLNEALDEELFSIDEKIMTKRQARKKKLRAKRRAEKKAAQKAEQEKQSQEQENQEQSTGTALVVYQEPQQQDEEYEEISEQFQKLVQILNDLNTEHQKEVMQAMENWKQVGEDKACPEPVWQALNETITKYREGVEKAVQELDIETLPGAEAQILDRYLTSINGYIEKAYKQIMAIKPNLVEDDFKAPAEAGNTEVVKTTGTALVPTHGGVPATIDTTPLEEPEEEEDDSRQYKKLVTYKKFWDNFKTLKDALNALQKAGEMLLKGLANGAKWLLNNFALKPLDFISDKLFVFLTSPLATDIVKMFMYINPITKMLFDGDFGSVSLKNAINGLHSKAKNFLNPNKGKGGNNKDITKQNPDNYTQRKLPKSVDKLTLKQLQREFYSNKALVDLINVSFNHPDVKIQDKAALRKEVTGIQRAFKLRNVTTIRSKFKNIIKFLDNICDYMNWVKPSDWQGLVKLYVKVKGGNTKKEEDKMTKINKAKKSSEQPSNQLDADTMEQLATLVADKINGKQESYFKISKLEKLLEAAEGE